MGVLNGSTHPKRRITGKLRFSSNVLKLFLVITFSTLAGFVIGSWNPYGCDQANKLLLGRKSEAINPVIPVLPRNASRSEFEKKGQNTSFGLKGLNMPGIGKPKVTSVQNHGLKIHQVLADVEQLKSILKKMIVGKPIVGTIANYAFKDMLLNWFAHIKKAEMVNALVVTLDKKLYENCGKFQLDCLLLSGSVSTKDFRADPEAFKSMGSLKTAFIVSVLELGWDLLMSDTDVAWISNPEEVLGVGGPMGFADALLSSDSLSISNDVASMNANPYVKTGDPQTWFRMATPRALEIFGNAYEYAMNTGVLFMRTSPATIAFATEWHEVMRTRGKNRGWDKVWGDQHALNELMRIQMFPIRVVNPPMGYQRHNRIFWAFNQSVKVGILSPAEFCNGHVYFVQKTPQRQGSKVYSIHNTFQYYFGAGKIARFREAGLWLLDDEDYYRKGNFLSFDVTLPSWIEELSVGIEKHQAAIGYYYEATRKALALARISQRILILPQVICYCDRWWNSLTFPCRAPGTDVDPPFVCPVDHFIDVGYWLSYQVIYRPSTFLENSLVDPAIKQSRALLLMEGRDGNPTMRNVAPVRMKVNATDTEAFAAFQNLKEFRVVHLPDAVNAFCRYEKDSDNIFFDMTTHSQFLLQWCCTPEVRHVNITLPKLAKVTYSHCNRAEP